MPRSCWPSRCRRFPGVALVDVYGSQKFAVRVQVDPVAAAARNISLDDIRRVIVSTNSNSPVGTLYGPQTERHAARDLRHAAAPTNTRMSWSPIATALRSSCRRSRASSTASRTTRLRAGSTTIARSCLRSSGSPAPIRSRWSIRYASGCRPTGRRCRPRSIWRSSSIVRSRSAIRSRTSRSRW